MLGLMQDQPLLISSLIDFAERHHGDGEIVSRRVEGDLHRYTYQDLAARSRQLANALAGAGLAPGEQVIVGPPQGLEDGQAVSVESTAPQ